MHSSYFCVLKFDCLIQIRSGFHFEIVTCLFEEEFSNFTSVSVHYKLYNFLMNSITTAVTKTSILLSRTTKQITPKSHTCARKKKCLPKIRGTHHGTNSAPLSTQSLPGEQKKTSPPNPLAHNRNRKNQLSLGPSEFPGTKRPRTNGTNGQQKCSTSVELGRTTAAATKKKWSRIIYGTLNGCPNPPGKKK